MPSINPYPTPEDQPVPPAQLAYLRWLLDGRTDPIRRNRIVQRSTIEGARNKGLIDNAGQLTPAGREAAATGRYQVEQSAEAKEFLAAIAVIQQSLGCNQKQAIRHAVIEFAKTISSK